MASFKLSEVSNLFPYCENLNKVAKDELSQYSVSTDSRNVKDHQIFLPIKGEKYDGHDFINEVLEKSNKSRNFPQIFSFCSAKNLPKVKDEFKANLLIVEDTLNAYSKLANYYRKKVNPKVIAVTGSSGKTTTKDLISSIVSTKYKTHKTQANHNNEIGLPMTILEMPSDTEVLVLELAMRAKGEIKYLSWICEPDIAVIINVGIAHIGRLGSRQSIIEAKCEVIEHLNREGLLVLNNDPRLIDCASSIWSGKIETFDLGEVKSISYKGTKTYFDIQSEKKNYFINALGKVYVLNSLCAIKVANSPYLGLSRDEIQSGLASFSVPEGRGNIIELSEDIYLVDETYNANPESVQAAVSNLIDCWSSEYKKILVLGELAELGEHKDVLLKGLNNWFEAQDLSTIITIGNELKQIKTKNNFSSLEDCLLFLRELMIPKTVVLIKGSHTARLDKLIKLVKINALKSR